MRFKVLIPSDMTGRGSADQNQGKPAFCYSISSEQRPAVRLLRYSQFDVHIHGAEPSTAVDNRSIQRGLSAPPRNALRATASFMRIRLNPRETERSMATVSSRAACVVW